MNMFSFVTDSHAEQRMRDAESSGDRFLDPARADPEPSPKGGTLRVTTHPDLVPSVEDAGEQAEAADKPRYYDKLLPSVGDLGTTTEGAGSF